MKKIYLHHYVFVQILMFLLQIHSSRSFPKNANSTLSDLQSLFNDKKMNEPSHPNEFIENCYKNEQENLRRSKREFHNENTVSNKKPLAKRETNYRTIYENDDIEIQEKELEEEESESQNINRFKRNNKKSKTKQNFQKRKKSNKKRNPKNQRIKKRNDQNSKNLRNQVAIFEKKSKFSEKNNTNILNPHENKTKDNITRDLGEMEKLEFFVKEGESENDFERRVARQIGERIDAIKEEIKRQVDEREKIQEIRKNNYIFDELQRQKYDVGCQDFPHSRQMNKRSLKKLQWNSRNSAKRKRKRKRCYTHQRNSKGNKNNSFSSEN